MDGVHVCVHVGVGLEVMGGTEAEKLAERSLLWGVLFLSTPAHLGLGTSRAIADGPGAQFL